MISNLIMIYRHGTFWPSFKTQITSLNEDYSNKPKFKVLTQEDLRINNLYIGKILPFKISESITYQIIRLLVTLIGL
ncbi:hypothetical protein Stok01_02994 [Sulfurisphaera tokodaii]